MTVIGQIIHLRMSTADSIRLAEQGFNVLAQRTCICCFLWEAISFLLQWTVVGIEPSLLMMVST